MIYLPAQETIETLGNKSELGWAAIAEILFSVSTKNKTTFISVDEKIDEVSFVVRGSHINDLTNHFFKLSGNFRNILDNDFDSKVQIRTHGLNEKVSISFVPNFSSYNYIFTLWKDRVKNFKAIEDWRISNAGEYFFRTNGSEGCYLLWKGSLIDNWGNDCFKPCYWGIKSNFRYGTIRFSHYIKTWLDKKTEKVKWSDISEYHRREILSYLKEYRLFIPDYMTENS